MRDQASDAGTTFSRRFRILELDPLEPEAIRAALAIFANGFEALGDQGPVTVTMSQGCIEFIVDSCLGDPFLFQLAGDAAWVAASSPAITEKDAGLGWQLVRGEATDYVTGRYNRLGELQATYLSVAAHIEQSERTAVAVATALARPARELGSTLEALLTRHRLLERTGRTLRFRSATVEGQLRGEWP